MTIFRGRFTEPNGPAVGRNATSGTWDDSDCQNYGLELINKEQRETAKTMKLLLIAITLLGFILPLTAEAIPIPVTSEYFSGSRSTPSNFGII